MSKDRIIPLKQIAKEIFHETIKLIDPERMVKERVRLETTNLIIDNNQINLARFNRILIIGFGKASLKMGVALESILNDRITGGLVVTNALLDNAKPERLEIMLGGHPYPNEGSWKAANRAIEFVNNA